MPTLEIDQIVLADYIDPLPREVEGIRLAPISEQADLAEAVGNETLYFCPDPWALRHRFISPDGEVIRARCDKWSCLYCGPRKTDQWRQLIAAAEPVSHVVLSRAGQTVEESARALTTFIQYLRRGSKGRGKNRLGARSAYPIEYFAVLERHQKFEESGFHWHLLIKGVDYIEKADLDSAWHSATHGKNDFAFIQRVTNPRAIGYVTKYLTKDLTRDEKGTKLVQREVVVGLDLDESGHETPRVESVEFEVASSARRIRYSRHFFPESVEDLRFRLFSGLDNPDGIERDLVPADHPNADLDGMLVVEVAEEKVSQEAEPEQPERPKWTLYEAEPFTSDIQEYRTRRRRALLESLMVVRAGQWRISNRVLSVWAFQRSQKYSSERQLTSDLAA